MAGVIATNTTLARTDLAAGDAARAAETGGLSGRPLAERAREVVAFVHQRDRRRAADHRRRRHHRPATTRRRCSTPGASLVQLYTGLIYQGPGLVRDINKSLA